jgi:ESCRT-II complex subunit VPS22
LRLETPTLFYFELTELSVASFLRFTKKAQELKAVSLASAVETVKKLEIKLADFAKKHKKEIQHDAAFRKRFLEMCAPLGVDPLSSEKGFWGMLGIGEFYYELAVKVAEVCIASRSRNGGIISASEVKSILEKRGTKFKFAESSNSSNYTKDDIIACTKKLSVLGSGFRTIQVGKTTMIVSVPTELDHDHMEIMSLAQHHADRGVTLPQIMDDTGWTKDRAKRATELLLTQGMAWLDVYRGRNYYWFPR